MKSAASSLPSTFKTYHELPPKFEALTAPSISRRGIGTTAHFPDWSSACLMLGVIQFPVGTLATSPLLNAPTNWLQSETILPISASIIFLYVSNAFAIDSLPSMFGVEPSSSTYHEPFVWI